jgi:hypothetical protein
MNGMTMTTKNKSDPRSNNRLPRQTIEEIRDAVESMDNKKAPGKDGIAGDIYNNTFQI